MKFSLKQVQLFKSIADHKSVSEAAKELFLSQSAASMALAQLETKLGGSLFTRQGRRMELTKFGLWLRPHVHRLLDTCHTIDMGMRNMDLVSGYLKLASSQTPAEHLVPVLLSSIDSSFPRLEISLAVENTEHVIEGLLDYSFDLGIIEGHYDDERIAQRNWCNDNLVIVASASHPYVQHSNVSLSQLAQASWVLRERGAGTREIFDENIHQHIDQLKVHREYDQINVILEMVARGSYLSCLSRKSVEAWMQSGRIKVLTVEELSMPRKFSFVWRKQDSENDNRDALINVASSIIE